MFKIRSSKNIKDDIESRKNTLRSKNSFLNSIENSEISSIFSDEFKNSLMKKDTKKNNGFSMQKTGGNFMINPDYM